MIDGRWAAGATVVVSLATLAAGGTSPPVAAVTGRDAPWDVGVLEGQVSRDPGDAVALGALAEAYLEHGAPGLAEAAIGRAPATVRAVPVVAHARARALWEIGQAGAALSSERAALDGCLAQACPRSLLGRASRRERWLAELARSGVDDPLLEPERALLAYRRATREVRLDVR